MRNRAGLGVAPDCNSYATIMVQVANILNWCFFALLEGELRRPELARALHGQS